MIATARLALLQLWRDRRLPVALGVLLSLALVCVVLERVRAGEAERDRRSAEEIEQQTFLGQGARNPHSVAHFSRFAFRPRLESSVLDPGISEYTGTAIWMEAHRQNVAGARPAEDRLDLGRASELGLAWLWQVVAPLLLIALGFDALARERERRTLAILATAGLSLRRLAAGKALALWAVLGGALLVSLLTALALGEGLAVIDLPARAAAWCAGYLVYLAVWTAITLAVSARARSSRAALITLLCIWALITLVVPRIAATLADERVPIPSPAEIWQAMEQDLENGFNGHAPASERSKQLEARVLARYGVRTLAELPVSFAGIALDEGERYGNLVFDKHYRALAERYARQRSWRRVSALVSPLTPLQEVSMASAGTDVEHHLDFTRQAEQQRRDIVARLNADMIANGAGKDFDYLAPPELWKSIPTFRYAPPRRELSEVGLAWLLLGAWALAAGLALALQLRWAAREITP